MRIPESLKNFVCKWGRFLSVLLSPGSLIFFILTIGSLYFSVKYKGDFKLSSLMAILGSIFGGVAGGFMKDEYDKIQGKSVLEKKGRSAIRNLDSISQQLTQVRNWIKVFITKKGAGKRELEEIERHLGTTEVNISSGLEDWIDIIPELKSTKEVVKNYEDLIKTYIEKILKNKKELIQVGENQELKKKLEKSIGDLEQKVKKLQSEQPVVFGGVPSSTTIRPFRVSGHLGSSVLGAYLNTKVCSNCGKHYGDDYSDNFSSITLGPNLCSDCKKIRSGLTIL